jgi:hypothetical protein
MPWRVGSPPRVAPLWGGVRLTTEGEAGVQDLLTDLT